MNHRWRHLESIGLFCVRRRRRQMRFELYFQCVCLSHLYNGRHPFIVTDDAAPRIGFDCNKQSFKAKRAVRRPIQDVRCLTRISRISGHRFRMSSYSSSPVDPQTTNLIFACKDSFAVTSSVKTGKRGTTILHHAIAESCWNDLNRLF